MKPIRNIFLGLTVGSAINTVMMLLLQQKLLIGPFVGVTVALAGVTAVIQYVDWRLRNNLLDLLGNVEDQVPATELGAIFDLEDDIRHGLSLTVSAKRIGELSTKYNFDAPLESAHV